MRGKSRWARGGLCLGLGLLLVAELCGWLIYLVAVGVPHEGLNANAAPVLTGPFLGPSTYHGYAVQSQGRDVSENVAIVMAVLDLCALFGLAVRSVPLRSRTFTVMAVALAALLAWLLFLGVLGHELIAAAAWSALVVGLCAAIRRVAPVRER